MIVSRRQWQAEVSLRCIGAGLCVAVAPAHFEFTEGRAQTTTDSIDTAEAVDVVRNAAHVCPAQAIAVSEI